MSCSRREAAISGPGSGLAATPCQISGGAFCLPELTCCFLLNDPAGNVRNDEAQAGPAVQPLGCLSLVGVPGRRPCVAHGLTPLSQSALICMDL